VYAGSNTEALCCDAKPIVNTAKRARDSEDVGSAAHVIEEACPYVVLCLISVQKVNYGKY
jgi:hypothetical protein